MALGPCKEKSLTNPFTFGNHWKSSKFTNIAFPIPVSSNGCEFIKRGIFTIVFILKYKEVPLLKQTPASGLEHKIYSILNARL